MNFLNDYAGFITLIQTIATVILSIVTIRLAFQANKISKEAMKVSEEALKVSREAIAVSKELAQLPYKKELLLFSWLDEKKDRYILSLQIINSGNMGLQIDEIIVFRDEGHIDRIEVDDGYVEMPIREVLAEKRKFNKYIVPQRNLELQLKLHNCRPGDEHNGPMYIVVRDSEGKKYTMEQEWAVG